MPRRPTPQAGEVAHLTVRCNNGEYLLCPAKNMSAIVSWLNTLPYFFSVKIHHTLIMSNHLHLLVTPQKDNLGQAMSYCLSNLSKYLNYENQRKNHVFCDRYFPTVIKTKQHLMHVVRYVYQNPVRANMVKCAREYMFSSFGQYLGDNNWGLALEPDYNTHEIFKLGLTGRDAWLTEINNLYTEVDVREIRKSLNRKEFKLTKEQIKELYKQDMSAIFNVGVPF